MVFHRVSLDSLWFSQDFLKRLQDRHQLEALQSETESLIEALESLLGEGFGEGFDVVVSIFLGIIWD